MCAFDCYELIGNTAKVLVTYRLGVLFANRQIIRKSLIMMAFIVTNLCSMHTNCILPYIFSLSRFNLRITHNKIAYRQAYVVNVLLQFIGSNKSHVDQVCQCTATDIATKSSDLNICFSLQWL